MTSDDDKGFGLATVRHALRTPVNHIIGYAEILIEQGEVLPPTFVTDLERIRNSGHVLLTLIERYLGENDATRMPVDVHTLGHEIRTPVSHIIGYAELLMEQCDDAAQSEARQDLVRIADAAKVWLELMEGRLVEPADPAARGEAGDAPSARGRAGLSNVSGVAGRGAKGERRGHVLLADDDEGNRNLLCRRLEKLGYRLTTCGDGRRALELAAAEGPDVVLLDLLMPGLNGLETLVQMKSDERLRHIPVIMISALNEVGAVARCIELGAEDYLAKPFEPILLRSRIDATLEKKRLRDAEQIYLRQIEQERERSERLLLNILPKPIATRLKTGEERIANSFDSATVLFSDLVGFSDLSTQMSPPMLIGLLDRLFSAFDHLAERHGMEKIKTIGDAYMVAAGVPAALEDHAGAAARMALDMQEVVATFNRKRAGDLAMRIGICSGPVIAGIIGRKKFTYDLWGDTVTTASRMESHGAAGSIHVAESTYLLLRDRFRFKERGVQEIKGKGKMKTFLLCRESEPPSD